MHTLDGKPHVVALSSIKAEYIQACETMFSWTLLNEVMDIKVVQKGFGSLMMDRE